MTLEDKLKVCATCKSRTVTAQDGEICCKTGKQPEFDQECSDYEVDPDDGISGFMAFFIYWSIPIGIAMTLASMIFTPEIAFQSYGSTWILLYNITFYAFYFYFQIYTIYAFVKKKSDAVFIAKYQLIVLFINNLVLLISGDTGNHFMTQSGRLIVSLAWTVIFFLYLAFSDDVRTRFPRENRKLTKPNKIIFILSLVLPFFLLLGTFFAALGRTLLTSDEEKIEYICENSRRQLPIKVSDELYWVNVSLDGQTVEYKYEYTESVFESIKSYNSDYVYEFLSDYQTELVKSQYDDLVYQKTDPLINIVAESDKYDLRFVYCSPEGEYAYEVNISNEELARFAEGEKYVTSTDDFKSLITAYNQMLPMDYFEGCQLMSCSLSKDGKTLRYKLQLLDMDMGSLAGVTSQSLKDYMMDMLPSMTDAPGVIARENDLKLSFDFTADCSDWWSSRVVIKPEEYKDLQITE